MDADLGYLDRALREKLTTEMGARGWKLKDVAAASGIPVSRLKRYMDDDRSFRLQDVDRLAGMLGMSIRELLGFDLPPSAHSGMWGVNSLWVRGLPAEGHPF